MGLHDRIATQRGQASEHDSGAGHEAEELRRVDPYAELKTSIHNACIQQLGGELAHRAELEAA